MKTFEDLQYKTNRNNIMHFYRYQMKTKFCKDFFFKNMTLINQIGICCVGGLYITNIIFEALGQRWILKRLL